MTDDKFLQMEKQYQDSLNSQKRYYESQLELLKSKLEYEKAFPKFCFARR